MASSLAVEWATKGIRVNALRHDEPALYPGVSAMILKQKVSPPPRSSPGYMMTKLTRTILSNNPELKVALLLHCLFLQTHAACQKTWESLTPMGRVWRLKYPLALEGPTDQRSFVLSDRWESQRIWTLVIDG